VSKSQIASHSSEIGGVVINAGCANACTGDQGVLDARQMVNLASELPGSASVPHALVMSTGVIGPLLDMSKIRAGFASAGAALHAQALTLAGTLDGWRDASLAIMTTDTVPKCLHRSHTIDGKSYALSGVCKGAGMIHPNMATLLSVIATDISISPACLQTALKYAVDRSFNSISIDGDTSTNDTVAVLANGQAEEWVQINQTQYGMNERRTG
jgi:glutamate N-acetyltransferase/amino-acid N-acetyltransferase